MYQKALFFLSLWVLSVGSYTGAVPRVFAEPRAQASISIQTLQSEIGARTGRVPEFAEIRRMAEKQGLRIWLFGGTAAAFAHYVKWDLMREAEDTRYAASRFDYDFTNIYRSTQDADLVVDGTPEQVKEFQDLVRKQFPYFMGSKDQWELRPLRHDMGEKKALLHNPDFLNQHTDSNSTGMIELTRSGEPVVRDLRDWNSEQPQFLRDIAEGKLHYYFSDNHETTSRFIEGKNPPIISVIRYLTKAFQFELELRAEDLAHIKRIIAEFDPKSALGTYIAGWLEGNGHKLLTHAVDVEYASNVLEELGLRQKLIEVSDPQKERSLGWWVNKEPLRSFPVGQGSGKTMAEIAAEHGISVKELVVAHETSDYLAYESLTRSTKSVPNVFISRKGFPGEVAMYGNGHYTMIGREGARGTGLTVRYRPNPNAREGTDFIVATDGMLLWKNRAALTVIQESLQVVPAEFLDLLLAGRLFEQSDRGVREKLFRKIRNRLSRLDPADISNVTAGILRHLNDSSLKAEELEGRLAEFFNLALSPELFLRLEAAFADPAHARLLMKVYRRVGSLNTNSRVVQRLLSLNNPHVDAGLAISASLDDKKLMHELYSTLFDRERSFKDGLSWAEFPRFPDLVEKALNSPFVDSAVLRDIVRYVLSTGQYVQRLDLFRKAVERGYSLDILRRFPTLIGLGFDFEPFKEDLARDLRHYIRNTENLTYYKLQEIAGWFSLPFSVEYPEIARALLWPSNSEAEGFSSIIFFKEKHWAKHADIVKTFLEAELKEFNREQNFNSRFAYLVHDSHLVFEQDTRGSLVYTITNILSLEEYKNRPDLVELFIDRPEFHPHLAYHVLSKPHWSHRKDWLSRILENSAASTHLISGALLKPHWRTYPEWESWIDRLVEREKGNVKFFEFFLLELNANIDDLALSRKIQNWIEAALNTFESIDFSNPLLPAELSRIFGKNVMSLILHKKVRPLPQWENWARRVNELRDRSLFLKAPPIPKEFSRLDAVDYFRLLSEGRFAFSSDVFIRRYIRERIIEKMEGFTEKQESELVEFVRSVLESKKAIHYAFLIEWMNVPVSTKHLDLLERILSLGSILIPRSVSTAEVISSRADVVSGANFLFNHVLWSDRSEFETLWRNDAEMRTAIKVASAKANCESLLRIDY